MRPRETARDHSSSSPTRSDPPLTQDRPFISSSIFAASKNNFPGKPRSSPLTLPRSPPHQAEGEITLQGSIYLQQQLVDNAVPDLTTVWEPRRRLPFPLLAFPWLQVRQRLLRKSTSLVFYAKERRTREKPTIPLNPRRQLRHWNIFRRDHYKRQQRKHLKTRGKRLNTPLGSVYNPSHPLSTLNVLGA
ncbi:hypothetical protein E2C01_059834 [Portunus trituberculatus]|uniref:Uncharacterized protein n=1 Tax=Portunus trituberculatus TaxID=210409 RepID=A0A5B7H9R4_PORTR|nr:hypothetical protein [Portunus trituberculatus]